MQTTMSARTPDAAAAGRPAIAYASYLRGDRTITKTLEQLATAAGAALAAGADATEHYLRALTDRGERTLTDDELVTVLRAMTPADDQALER